MKKLIVLDDTKAKKGIKKCFDCTDAYISQSLRFIKNSENSKKIRLSAMRSGGILMQEVTDWQIADIK